MSPRSGVRCYAIAKCYTCGKERDGMDVNAIVRWAREHARKLEHETFADVTETHVFKPGAKL